MPGPGSYHSHLEAEYGAFQDRDLVQNATCFFGKGVPLSSFMPKWKQYYSRHVSGSPGGL